MTTSSERKFPPKKQVPDKMFLLVRVAKVPTEAKPFTKTVTNKETNQPEEKTVRQVNLHFQIADKRYPDLCGQWHIMQATDYISDDSKLFKALTVLIGPDRAAGLSGLCCFPRTWPDGNQTPPEKLVPAETWNGLVGKFFGAEFNPPRKDDSGAVRRDADGSVFQTVKDVNTLIALGWTEDQWKLWPPPKQTNTPAQTENKDSTPPTTAHQQQASSVQPGLPPANPPAPTKEDKPQTKPAVDRDELVKRVRWYVDLEMGLGSIAKAHVKAANVAGVSALSVTALSGLIEDLEMARAFVVGRRVDGIPALDEADQYLLKLLQEISSLKRGNPNAATQLENMLKVYKKPLLELDADEIEAVRNSMKSPTDDSDVPF